MKRRIEELVKKDLKEKIVFISGPRQVGKTTLSKQLNLKYDYLNYDSGEDRRIILKQEWNRKTDLVIFDEIHKMKKWKTWIKGVYDTEGVKPAILVTGSARLDVYRKGGDSLTGRYFSYRLHPLTVREASSFMESKEALNRILKVGGFPELFLKNDTTYAKRWRRKHLDNILREDLIDLEKLRDIKSMEILLDILRERVGSLISYASIARDLQVSIHTVKHWLEVLENLYVIFPVRPYHKNIARSLLKESKYYFYDTGAVKDDEGARLENAVACSLLGELHYHEDTTGDKVELNFIRDKEKREVDFLVSINKTPKFLVEVKTSDENC
ncbi:MAG: hypothetical protein ACD_79C01302G0023, partial [uncultured bacterium]